MTKCQISTNYWLLLLVISLLFLNAHAAWLSGEPGVATQPESTTISVLWDNDDFLHWTDDTNHITMNQDPINDLWAKSLVGLQSIKLGQQINYKEF